jgi:hypothetical protein
VLPWNEKVVSFQLNPESATVSDIVRMAEELVSRREGMSERNLFDYDGPIISEQHGREPSIRKLIGLYYRAYGIVGTESDRLVEEYIKRWLALHGEGKEQPKPPPDEWEEWIGKRPYSWGMRDEIDKWFMEMPKR